MATASIIVIILMATMSIGVYYEFFEGQVKTDMKFQANLVKNGYEHATDKNAYLDTMYGIKTEIRVSIIEPDGNVSFDTRADATYLNEHLDRPEIQQAIQTGFGESVRHSKTLEQNTYYCALMLSDGNIIRISNDTQSVMSVFLSIVPLAIAMIGIILIVCLIISKMLTNMIVKPLIKLGDNIDELTDGANYDELNPFVERISQQNRTITNQLQVLIKERDTITVITNNMQEGLVLLGNDRYILSVNKAALTFLNSRQMNFVGQNFIVLTRESKLIESIDKALTGVANDGIIKIDCKSYHYFSNPVYENSIVNGTIMLILDVTEKQKVEKIRQEFSANVSHELKTPLTTISGFAEMIQNDMVQNKEDLINFAGLIHSEASRLLVLIEDVMRLSQIEEHVESKDELVDLYLVAQNVIKSLAPKAKKRNIELNIKGTSVMIKGNSSMLEELIYNLVDNGVKYNIADGKVVVYINSQNGQAIVRVCDTGIGISQKHHDRIFERFYRVDKSRSKQTGGMGLGLSIVKHIVEFHHGTIALETEENKGTSITITL